MWGSACASWMLPASAGLLLFGSRKSMFSVAFALFAKSGAASWSGLRSSPAAGFGAGVRQDGHMECCRRGAVFQLRQAKPGSVVADRATGACAQPFLREVLEQFAHHDASPERGN